MLRPAMVTTTRAATNGLGRRVATSPPMQERAVATRARLLEAAIDVLVRRGYAGTSTVEVCRRAKASRGAHLHHFPTKAELLAAAIEHLFARRLTEFRDELLPLVGRRGRMSVALAAMWSIYSGPTLAAWMELAIASRTDAQLRRHIAGIDQRFFAHARAAMVELFVGDRFSASRTSALTRLLLSAFDGLALHHLSVPADDPAPVLAELERLLTPLLEET